MFWAKKSSSLGVAILLAAWLGVSHGDVGIQISSVVYNNPSAQLVDGTKCFYNAGNPDDKARICYINFVTSIYVPPQKTWVNMTGDPLALSAGDNTFTPVGGVVPNRPSTVQFFIFHKGISYNDTAGTLLCLSCQKPMDVFTLDLTSTYPAVGPNAPQPTTSLSFKGPNGSQLTFQYQLYCTDPTLRGANCDMTCQPLPNNNTLVLCQPVNQPQNLATNQNDTSQTLCLLNPATNQVSSCQTCPLGIGGNGCIVGDTYTGPVYPNDYSDFKVTAIFFVVFSAILLIVLIGVLIAWRKKEVSAITRRISARGREESPRTYAAPKSYSSNPRAESEWLNPGGGGKNGRRLGDEEVPPSGARRSSRDGAPYYGNPSPSHSRATSDDDGGPPTPRREAQV